ncbi:hypothetical protein [Ahniella affigens]|uniref:hypothetical protein n=1 Tax=Ahniella affigens TaxID=2021234 RepID=UPI0011B1F4DC|nr:hypothetical protein [Ahniella affigens]
MPIDVQDEVQEFAHHSVCIVEHRVRLGLLQQTCLDPLWATVKARPQISVATAKPSPSNSGTHAMVVTRKKWLIWSFPGLRLVGRPQLRHVLADDARTFCEPQ